MQTEITPNALNRLPMAAWLTSRGFQEINLTDQDINKYLIDTASVSRKNLVVFPSPFDPLQQCKLYVHRRTNMFQDEALGITGFPSDFLPCYFSCSIKEILSDPDLFDVGHPIPSSFDHHLQNYI